MTKSDDREKTKRYEEIVLPNINAAYNLARWLVRYENDAEDVVQEACLRAFKYIDGFRGGDSRTWLLSIVRNTSYTWLQRNRAHELNKTSFDEEIHREKYSSNPETMINQAIDNRMLRDIINKTLEEIPVEFREVIILRELENLSYKEISGLANIPLGTVMSRLARARVMLQERLKKYISKD